MAGAKALWEVSEGGLKGHVISWKEGLEVRDSLVRSAGAGVEPSWTEGEGFQTQREREGEVMAVSDSNQVSAHAVA